MKCKHCGTENPDNRTTCQNCGAPISKDMKDETAIGMSLAVIALIVVGIICVGFVIGILCDIYDSGGWWAVILAIVGFAIFAYVRNK